MKKFPILACVFSFLLATTAFAKIEVVLGDIPIEKNLNIPNLIPSSINNSNEVIISRKQYALSFNRKQRLPNWVAWKIDSSDIGHIGRSPDFYMDDVLEKYLSGFSEHVVQPTDYFGSCYDRGHQVPSADRDVSVEDNQATFIMSNIIPQTPNLNRGVWAHLETYTRSLVVNQGKKVYIVAGPIYDQDFGKIGPEKNIPVPSKNFKLIYILNSDQTVNDINSATTKIAVIIPNVLADGQKPLDNQEALCASSAFTNFPELKNDWQQYQTTIENIENLSGFKLTR